MVGVNWYPGVNWSTTTSTLAYNVASFKNSLVQSILLAEFAKNVLMTFPENSILLSYPCSSPAKSKKFNCLPCVRDFNQCCVLVVTSNYTFSHFYPFFCVLQLIPIILL